MPRQITLFNDINYSLYDKNEVEYDLIPDKWNNYDSNYYKKSNNTEDDKDNIFNKFYALEEALADIADHRDSTYYKTDVLKKLYKKNDGRSSYEFNVMTNYASANTIDAKFHALDQVLKTSYYTNTDIDTESPPLYPISYSPPELKKQYKFNVIDKYYDYNTIDAKFCALYQALEKSYYKKTDKTPDQEAYKFNVMKDYYHDNNNTIEDKRFELDKSLKQLIFTMTEKKDANENITNIINKTNIDANKETLENQKARIAENTSAIMSTISELKEVIVNNKKEISSNTDIIRPFDELITKIFNTLAAQANEEISLNREVIEENNESLNKMNQNNESQADNNALYVMVTALTAPFIGLSLYYSSDTEENIDNEIEAF